MALKQIIFNQIANDEENKLVLKEKARQVLNAINNWDTLTDTQKNDVVKATYPFVIKTLLTIVKESE